MSHELLEPQQRRFTEPNVSPTGIRGYLGQVYNTSDGPHEMELGHAMSGILNLQFVHDLKSYDVGTSFYLPCNVITIMNLIF